MGGISTMANSWPGTVLAYEQREQRLGQDIDDLGATMRMITATFHGLHVAVRPCGGALCALAHAL